ncbi:TPA_asm: adenylate cyclase, partial [Salmonella enterica]
YRIGDSLRSQLDPDAVGALRSLAGSRYDLTDRNNDIILEYRKQEVTCQ